MRYWSNYENRRHNGQGDLKYLYQSPATIWQVHGTRTTDQRQRHSSEDQRAKRRHLFAPQANRQLSRGRATATTIAAKLGNAHCSVIKRTPTHTDQCRETRLADMGRAENQICPYRARRARTQALVQVQLPILGITSGHLTDVPGRDVHFASNNFNTSPKKGRP